MYRWTPAQVTELPLEIFEWLPAIESAMDEADHMERRAEEARNRRPGRGRG